jgi:excinuclease ABC subunit C
LQILSRQTVISTTQDNYDVAGAYQTNHSAVVSVLRIQEGRVVGQKAFSFNLRGDENEAAIIRNFLISIYLNFSDIPGLIVTGQELEDTSSITDLLESVADHRLEIRVAERGEKRQMFELARKNARAKLETRLLKTDQAYSALIALQDLLKLPDLPSRIEAVDISNLGASEPVGATVCFIDGKPDKNEYRRYKIQMRHYVSTKSKAEARQQNDSRSSTTDAKDVRQAPNDFAMIREIVNRRFHDTKRSTPDVFVVDGGPEQLKFALEGLVNAPVQPKVIISLAKKPDRVFLPGRKLPIAAPRGNKGLYLLSRIRDEVHRFGITFQRTRQRRKSLSIETIDSP